MATRRTDLPRDIADQDLLWADQYEPWHHCTCMWCSNPNEIEITDTMVEAAEREREAFGR